MTLRDLKYGPIALALLITISTACKKLVQIPAPNNLITSTEVFSDSMDATSALTGIYIDMQTSATTLTAYQGNLTVFTGLSSDELATTRNLVVEGQAYQNALQPTNSSTNAFWSISYSLIYKANACIEGVTASNNISAAAKNDLIGEAKFLRAFFYFTLVNLYGAVPLETSTDYKINSVMPRTTPDSVYQQIIKDLIDAQSLLTDSYPTPGKIRPNKSTATAFLAKVYLYQKRWADAESASSQVISNANYSLEPNLNNVFLAGSSEAIWQLSPFASGYETSEGFVFVPTSQTAKPKYIINSFLLNAFDSNDLRAAKGNWINYNTVGGKKYYFPFKYKLGFDGSSSPVENYMVFRLADQYLIRAEARAQIGSNLSGAASDLNMIRSRAGLASTSATTQADLITAIYHERQVEMFCEWGNRWFDLKRTGLINSVMSTVTPVKGGSWSQSKALFPLNITDLLNNPFLTQNPGY